MKLSPRRTGAPVATAVVLALFGALASPASAKVTWGGIGPVKLGMTEAELRAKLGEPTSVDDKSTYGVRFYTYRRHKFRVAVSEDQVAGVRTASRAHRTQWGIRVGSSHSEMRRRVRGESCGTGRFKYVCSVARGKSVIGFVSRRGRVALVEVGRTG